MSERRNAVVGIRCCAWLVAAVSMASLAACGDGGSTKSRSDVTSGAIASSAALEACIKAWGGPGTVLERPSKGFSGLPAHHAFDVSYPEGTTFSVAVEQTPAAAQRLQSDTQGVLVGTKVVGESVSEEAPAEMRDAAAATVHRLGNVVILYSDPRQQDDAGVAQCVTRAT